MMEKRRAFFLDRDGVIVKNRPDHVKSWSEVHFLHGAFPALRRLAETPAAIVIISNQGSVGRGIITLETAWEIQRRIVAEIEAHGGRIDASYLCPHHPDDGCECRKPAPGMILQAAEELSLDLPRSWLIGDALTDLLAAAAAGTQALLVRTGRGAEQEKLLAGHSDRHWPVCADLADAVQRLCLRFEESIS